MQAQIGSAKPLLPKQPTQKNYRNRNIGFTSAAVSGTVAGGLVGGLVLKGIFYTVIGASVGFGLATCASCLVYTCYEAYCFPVTNTSNSPIIKPMPPSHVINLSDSSINN